jgi:hypothetical protein
LDQSSSYCQFQPLGTSVSGWRAMSWVWQLVPGLLPARVHVGGEGVDAVGEALRVGDGEAEAVDARAPAGVDVDVLVAGGLQASGEHVRDLAQVIFGQPGQAVAGVRGGEHVEAVPAHRRAGAERLVGGADGGPQVERGALLRAAQRRE